MEMIQLSANIFRIIAFGYSLFLIAMVPITRSITDWMKANSLLVPITGLVGTFFILGIILWFSQKLKKLSRYQIVLFVFLVGLYGTIFTTLHYPIECFHFINFSLLFIFFQNSIPENWPQIDHITWPIILTLFVGTIDEFIQAIIPNRHGEFGDLLYCAYAIVLGQLLHISLGYHLPKKA